MRYFRVGISREPNDGDLVQGYVQAPSEEDARRMLPQDPGLYLIDQSHKLRPAREVELWTKGGKLIQELRASQGIDEPPAAYEVDGYRNSAGAAFGTLS
ncbi:hypothetical protein ACQ5SO_17315 [Rhodovulum sp. DZ06]|uniref:hypothetical protein n=1 Tax=Rhodovulum sp. DZ06 TaxID=3425126 RepID=UPI003D3278C9